MEFITEHWLSLGVAIYLLAMVLYGHYRGFLRMAVTFAALVLSVVFVRTAMPHMTSFLKENTKIHEMIQETILRSAWDQEDPGISGEETGLPARQRQVIEELKLPQQIKDALLENNNHEVYEMLGVSSFFEYVGSYLADMFLNLIGTVVLFVAVFVVLRLLIRWLDLLARLPILYGINQIAGAVLGAVQGMAYLWIACLVVSVCSETFWGKLVLEQVRGSFWLNFLYENNLLSWLFFNILKNLA